MTSLYAASSIHSKSTLSRKYDVDTSNMWNAGEKFRVKEDQTTSEYTLNNFIVQFSLDVGRFFEVNPWINRLRLVVFPFFYILGCSGILIVPNYPTPIFNAIIHILRSTITFLPQGVSLNVSITFNVALLFVYATLLLLLLRNVLQYRRGSVPSRNDIYLWMVTSRLMTQFFSCYISYYLSHNLVNIVGTYETDDLINLLIAIPLIIIQFVYIFFSCSVYNATPILRSNDVTQLWYSQSFIDWQVNLVLFLPIFLQCVLLYVPSPIKQIFFVFFVALLSTYFALSIWLYMPFMWPKVNALVVMAAFSGYPFSFFPLVSYYIPKHAQYYFLVCVVLVPATFYMGKFMVSYQCKRVLKTFNTMHDEIENEGSEDGNLDPLSAAILNLNKTTNVDFVKLGISGDRLLSLYMRIGYWFNVPEVEDQTYIKWSIDQCLKADLLLSACQVSLALQNDNRMLNSLSVQVSKLSSGPYNTKSFAILFDFMRQELITQLNQPLLDSVTKCKRASYVLQNFIGEFWGSVMKQRMHSMYDVIPQISHEMIRTDTLFNNICRNYPRSPTVFRETVIIQHKLLGDHAKTLDLQAKLTKLKKLTDADSERSSSTDLDDIDHNFVEQIEPWVSVQSIITNIKSLARFMIIFTSCTIVILLVLMPLFQLAFALIRIDSFLKVADPIKVIGDIQFSISRIPQLIRRMNLFSNDVIENVDVGPVKYTLNEIINMSSCRKYLEIYVNELENKLSSFLDSYTKGKIPGSVCSDQNYKMISGNTTSYTSLYNLLSSYLLAASTLKDHKNFTSVDHLINFQFIFDNFDSAEAGITSVLSSLNENVVSFHDSFNKLSIYFYIDTCCVPVFLIIPLIILNVFYSNREVKFILRLFLSISKSEISGLRSSMKSSRSKDTSERMSKDDDGDEMNIRKDELIENLSTVTRYRDGIFIRWVIVCCLFTAITCLFSCIGIYVIKLSMTDIIDMTNAYTYSITVYSNAASCYVWAQELFANKTVFANKTQIENKSSFYVNRFKSRFDTLLYGSSGASIVPGLTLGSEIGDVYTKSNFIDTRVSVKDPVIGVIHDVYYSLSCEAQVSMFTEISTWLFNNSNLTYTDPFVYHFEHMLFAHIIPFLERGMDIFYSKVESLNTSKTNELLIVYVLLVVFQILYALTILLRSSITFLHHVATPRKLMCLVPPEGLMKSPTIVKWFSGSISASSDIQVESRSATYHETIDYACDFSRCGVCLLDEFLQVQSCNKSFKTMMKCELNEHIRSILVRCLVDKDKLSSIQRLEKASKKMSAGVAKSSTFSFESVVAGEKNNFINVLVTLHGCSDADDVSNRNTAQSFAIIVEDYTTMHSLDEALRAEQHKINSLMTLIMPPSIKSKQDEGLDTFFNIENGSVIVATIKSEILNEDLIKACSKIFAALDKALDADTIRIRTCGLSYIAATGIISRTKSPGQSTVDVSLKMISQCMSAIDNSSYSISVGIHTGNIKCGMVGSFRPVFDVIGDTATSAMKLSDVSPPWLIHISERTYGEIKFLKYNVKEVGSDERGRSYLISNTDFSNNDSTRDQQQSQETN